MVSREYKFIPEKGMARITSDLNVRKDGPSSQNGIAVILHAGLTQTYLGYVLDGESVAENSKWFLTPEGNFFWSGNTDIHNISVPQKILAKPLDTLLCTQKFGERPEFYGPLGSPKGHNGVDFRTRDATDPANWKKQVYSVLGGTVSEATENKFNGKYIRIAHENGYESVYLHLSELSVFAGQKVSTGAKIGISGNSGAASEAPHLHFGYRPTKFNKDNGYMGYVDPLPFFVDDVKSV